MNESRPVLRPRAASVPQPRPVAAALAGIGFAAVLLAPAPLAVAAEPATAVVARPIGDEPHRIAQALPNEALNNASTIGPRAPRSQAKLVYGLTVTSTADTLSAPAPSGTLREVLAFASSNCYGTDIFQVSFAIPPADPGCSGGVCTIATSSGFYICSSVEINGYTQAGAFPNTIPAARDGSNAVLPVVIDGSGMTGGPLISIDFTASSPAVRGLALVNWPASGSAIQNYGSNTSIGGNFIGVGAAGTACSVSAGPSKTGITNYGSNAMIGGISPSDRNVIGCSTSHGIFLGGSSSQVLGNLIGLGADGSTDVGNDGSGIFISSSGSIGGQGTSEGNVIAYNGAAGVQFGCFPTLVSGNDIFLNSLIGIDTSQAPPSADSFAVTYGAGGTSIAWSAGGFPNMQTVTMEFFDNSDPGLGLDQGQMFVGACAPMTDISGNAACTATIPGIYRHLTRTLTLFSQTSGFLPALAAPDMVAKDGSMNVVTSLGFPATPLGASSSPVVLNLFNSGDAPLVIDSIAHSLPGDFFDTTGGPPPNSGHYCGVGSDASGAPLTGSSASVSPGTSCVMNLAFRPQASGTRTGTLTFNDASSPNYSVSVTLTGSGGTVVPLPTGVTFSPTSLMLPGPVPAFSTLSINVANPNGAPAQGLALTQSLPAGLVIAPTPNATVTGASCSGSFLSAAPGGTSFTVDSLFVPTSGACNLNIDVTSGAPGVYPVSVPAGAMTGGTILSQAVSNALSTPSPANLAVNAASLMMSPPSPVDFGAVTVGSSAPVSVTLTNTGAAPLNFSAPFAVTGPNAADFSFTDTCVPDPVAQLGPGASCTVTVTFAPSAIGGRSASMSFPSNTLTSPDVLNLTGTGTALPVPVVSLTPSGMVFPPQTVGTTSSPQPVTLTNVGTAPLAISGIGTTGDFAQSSACGTSLAPTVSCTISVTFTPVTAGLRTGDLKVFSNASGSPHIVALDGDGVAPPVPTITAPTSVTFPTTQVGSASSPVSITITNSGGGPLVVSAVEIVGTGFTKASDSCTGASVPPSSSCVVSVTFSPSTAGSTTATLRILSNAPTSPTFVGLSGTGSAAPVGILSASASTLSFAAQVVGTTSAAQGLVITNTGGAPVTVSSITVSGDFAQAGSCASIPAGGSCTVNVTFTPTATGTRTGALSVASDASNAPLSVGLTGTATPVPAPVIELSASSLSYGNAMIGGGGTQALTLRNIGGAPLTIANLLVTGEFQATSGCPAVVPAGESCRIDVGFRPTVPGPRSGRIDVLSNASNGTKGVDLAGTGCRFSFMNRVIALVCQ